MTSWFTSNSVCVLAAVSFSGFAQSYPAKPVRIVVPFVPGGPTDVIARELSQKLSEFWKQPVVVDNRPGAGSNLAADLVAKSAPDGYTVLITNPSLAVSPSLYRKLPFDAMKDFLAAGQIASTFFVMTATPDFSNLRDLVDYAKANPGKLNYATPGVGSINHLMSELFNLSAGIKLAHVPYKGDPESMRAMLANEVQFAMVPPLVVLPQVKAGKMRALAVSSAARARVFPDTPSIVEAGLPDVQYTGWLGLFAPAGTPAAVVNEISAATARAVRLPDLSMRLSGFGFDPVGSTPAEFTDKFRTDVATFARAVKQAGVPLND